MSARPSPSCGITVSQSASSVAYSSSDSARRGGGDSRSRSTSRVCSLKETLSHFDSTSQPG